MTRQNRITLITVCAAVAVTGLFLGIVFAVAPGSSSSPAQPAPPATPAWQASGTAISLDG